MTNEAIAKELGSAGKCICPNFISTNLSAELRNDFSRAQAAGEFSRAGTGQGKEHEVRNSIRRDDVCWLSPETQNPGQAQLLYQLDDLKTAFNRTLFLGLTSLDGHYASYPAGGFHQKHLDCFHESDARKVSVILYLNHNWKLADGGQLRIHENNLHTDIDPVSGTLVCFLSHEFEHEVLESHEARSSFAGWFKTS